LKVGESKKVRSEEMRGRDGDVPVESYRLKFEEMGCVMNG
jgi:hypothetical protein